MSVIWDILKIKIRIKQLIFIYKSLENDLLSSFPINKMSN